MPVFPPSARASRSSASFDRAAPKARAVLEPLEARSLMSVATPAAVPWSVESAGVGASLTAAPAAPAVKSAVTLAAGRSHLGGNLNGETDRVQDHPFTDLVKTTRGFYNLAGRTYSNGKPAFAFTDANGWPTEDFAVSLADNAEYKVSVDAGTYHMSFKGPAGVAVTARANAPGGAASVPAGAPLPTLKLLSFNASTGVYTYDINVPAGVQTLALDFRKTGGKVRDLKVLQPGYSLSGYPTFRTEYLNLLRNLGPNVLRLMDFTHTNNSLVANWNDRAKPTDATQAKVNFPGDLQPAKGIAWEYAVQLANALGTSVWVNVPAHATNDYVTKLATLLKNSLNSNLTIYLEYSNEVWNTAFEQSKYNSAQAQAEVKANPGSNLKYDGTTNATTIADRRYARRLKEITDLFKSAWAAGPNPKPNPLNGQVKAVLGGQLANPSRFDNELAYLNKFYGAPKSYLWGIGVAPYINLGGLQNKEGLTKDQVLAALQGSANAYKTGTSLSNAKAKASAYGLKLEAYEGGIDTYGSTSIAAKRAAVLDPRVTNIITQYLNTWYAKGGDQFNWVTLGARSYNSPYGTWSITENIRDFNSPKEAAFRAVRDAGLGN